MSFDITEEADLGGLAAAPLRPVVLSADELLSLKLERPSMLIDNLLAKCGANLIVGAQKSNKTLLMAQVAIAIVTGRPLFEQYVVNESGPILFIEVDDPAGNESIQDILNRSPVPTNGIRFFTTVRLPFELGPEFNAWLEHEIRSKGLVFVCLDSYTALRPSRKGGSDLVKIEREELSSLDELAKRNHCSFGIIHHESQASRRYSNWADRSASSYVMTAATEMMIHTSRFLEFESSAPERLIRTRGRHDQGMEFVVRFRRDTLDHEFLLEGGAAEHYPLLRQLRNAFGSQTFGPRNLVQELGISRSTAHRQIDRLSYAGAIRKLGPGDYVLCS